MKYFADMMSSTPYLSMLRPAKNLASFTSVVLGLKPRTRTTVSSSNGDELKEEMTKGVLQCTKIHSKKDY